MNRGRFTLTALGVLLCFTMDAAAAEDPEVERIAAVLDDMHAAASEADGERYFSHFSETSIFLGTDGDERWTKTAFQGFADPYFSQGKGWTYRVVERHITREGAIAWFDEVLDNDSYGECRGTGVLRQHEDGWKIEQYNLTIPIPNDLAKEVVGMIRAAESSDDE
ncbi:MAG: nuclear transport factor 2 family protein [Acidobacteriota bacterium]